MNTWWKKQNTNLKVAYIGGCFGILVAIVSAVFTSFLENKAIFLRHESPTVSIKYMSFGGERFLYAENVQNPSEKYDISTNVCLQLQSNVDLVTLKTQPNSNWSGNINTLITTNLPIVIERLELEMIDYQVVDSTIRYKVKLRQPGQQGGGSSAFAKTVITNSVIISPQKRAYDLILNQAFEMSSTESVIFSTPVVLTKPGKYVIKVNPILNDYSQILGSPELTENLIINWVVIPHISANEIENPYSDVISVFECTK